MEKLVSKAPVLRAVTSTVAVTRRPRQPTRVFIDTALARRTSSLFGHRLRLLSHGDSKFDRLIQSATKRIQLPAEMRLGFARFSTQPRTIDLDPQLSATIIVNTSVDQHKRLLNITWNDGDQTSYPYAWLRDSCQCSTCSHPSTGARRLHFHELDLNLTPTNVETNSSMQEVVVTWSDDHRSNFRYSWLLARSFRFAEQTARARWNGRHAVLWGSDMAGKIPQVAFNKLLNSSDALYTWLTALEETGFALVTGAPHEAGQIQRIAAKVAFLRQTYLGYRRMYVVLYFIGNTLTMNSLLMDSCQFYSSIRDKFETSFENHHKENSTDETFTLSSQELHNDLTCYYNVPWMKMVHCISQPVTGDVQSVQFVDGFKAARQLKDRYPEQFRLLSTTKLEFYGTSLDSVMLSRHATIKLDDAGDVIQINYSTRHRDSYSRLAVDEIEPLYRALKIFAELLYEKQNIVEIKLKNDVIYCFNNWRVLHGRKAFQLVPGSEPIIERGYIDWDELHSKRRVIKFELGLTDDDN